MNRSTVILLFLLLALGAITYFLLPSGAERQTSYEAHDVHFTVDSASVMRIEIKRPLSLTTLQNVGGTWMVTTPFHYTADPASVQQLVGGLSKFKVGSPVSSNPEKQRLFQVDSLGTFVTVTDRNGASQSLVVGKMGPSFSEVYFRLPDGKDVYLGEGIDSWMFTKEPKEWRNKTILASHTEGIKELEFTVGNMTTSFVRDSAGWRSGDKLAPIERINPSLTALMELKADDFIDSLVQFKYRPLTLKIKGTEDVALSLYPLDADSARYALQTSKSPQLFVVSKYIAGQIMTPVEGPSRPGTARQRAAVPEKKRPRPVVVEQKPVPPKHEAGTITAPAVTQKKPTPQSVPTTKAVQQPVQKKSVPEKPAVQKSVPEKTPPVVIPTPVHTAPGAAQTKTPGAAQSKTPATTPSKTSAAAEDEGDLNVHTVKRGETMTTIAKQFNVTVDQIIKWNQLKSISVHPGQELYVFIKK